MARKGSAFAGLSVAMVTPFRDGELDLKALRDQVEFQVEAGTSCLCPVGTTGESPTLSHDEHERVISEVSGAGARRGQSCKSPGSGITCNQSFNQIKVRYPHEKTRLHLCTLFK